MKAAALVLLLALLWSSEAGVQYGGTNLSGADFGSNLPGTFGVDYTYPTNSEVDYFVSKGLNVFRVNFRWERLQQSALSAFDATEQGRLTSLINYITVTKGKYALLDPHNYARYYNNIIGASSVTIADFTNFWTKLATLFLNNNKVIFGLVNEPNSMQTELWGVTANQTIAAIRATGARQLILIPGNGWTGAWDWTSSSNYGTANSAVMGTVVDSAHNSAYEVHQYLDSDSSGTSSTCVSSTIGSQRITDITNWARSKGVKLFLGEFAGASNAVCNSAVTDLLNFVKTNSDIWIGWTWWSAGPWWGAYMFTLEPSGSTDAPQLSLLTPFLAALTPPSGTASSTTSTSTTRPATITSTSGVGSTSTTRPATITSTSTSGAAGSTSTTRAASSTSTTRAATSTSTSGTATSATSSSSSSCSVHYAVTNQWVGGFGATVTITNTGTTAINSWSLVFTFANGQTITQLWNGGFTQSGGTVTITNISYNGSIPPGTAVSSAPGFNGAWTGTNNAPTSFRLNGVSCTVV